MPKQTDTFTFLICKLRKLRPHSTCKVRKVRKLQLKPLIISVISDFCTCKLIKPFLRNLKKIKLLTTLQTLQLAKFLINPQERVTNSPPKLEGTDKRSKSREQALFALCLARRKKAKPIPKGGRGL